MPASDAIKLLKHYESVTSIHTPIALGIPREHADIIRAFISVAAPDLMLLTYLASPEEDTDLFIKRLMRHLRERGFNL